MSLCDKRDGHYNKNGVWVPEKLCLVDCKERCTCRPPDGMWLDQESKLGKILKEANDNVATNP